MPDQVETSPISGITALPSITANRISSGQVLIDPSSVVKELIDNALDARVKSIFVDIAANTIDCIQVKDDGHGIPTEGRALACRRHCTSKIRDFHDLKTLCGKWLGFRGEALSSMAEMSASLSIITRVEGEPVAVKLEYKRDGELAETTRDSHPVGTTVKVTNFFECLPVRKQTAIKSASKCFNRIRRLIQGYALARPAIRFRLHILKGKNSTSDLVYSPKVDADIQDAILKLIGKDCALQCEQTSLEADGFEIHAVLPKPFASGSKVVNQGAFVSVDARPVSANRGIAKQIIAAFKNQLLECNPAFESLKNPFLFVSSIQLKKELIVPRDCGKDGLYDINIEPAKDDVMFDDQQFIMNIIDELLRSYYTKRTQETNDSLSLVSTQINNELSSQDPPSRWRNSPATFVNLIEGASQDILSQNSCTQSQWRSSMYGIDLDDLQFLQDDPLIVEDQEEARQAASLSNPWTIMRMKPDNKSKKSMGHGQVPSPAKSQSMVPILTSCPAPMSSSPRLLPHEPLMPRTSPRSHLSRSSSRHKLEPRIMHPIGDSFRETSKKNERETFSRLNTTAKGFNQFSSTFTGPEISQQSTSTNRNLTEMSRLTHPITIPGRSSSLSPAPARHYELQSKLASKCVANNIVTNQGALEAKLSPKTGQLKQPWSQILSSPGAPRSDVVAQNKENSLCSGNDTGIRKFLTRNRLAKRRSSAELIPNTTLMSIHSPVQRDISCLPVDDGNDRRLRNNLLTLPSDRQLRAGSEKEHQLSYCARNRSDNHTKEIPEPLGLEAQLGAYMEQENLQRPPFKKSEVPTLFKSRTRNAGRRVRAGMMSGTEIEPLAAKYQSRAYNKMPSQQPVTNFVYCEDEHSALPVKRTREVSLESDSPQPEKFSSKVQDMIAQFQVYGEEKEGKQFERRQDSSNRRNLVSSPGAASKSNLPRRRRTTAESQRTRSSKLPLERVPQQHRIHNVILSMTISVVAIIQKTRKLNMKFNSQDWSFPVETAHSIFDEYVTKEKITNWVYELDVVLHEKNQKISGMNSHDHLLQGIRHALDVRRPQRSLMKAIQELEPSVVRNDIGEADKDKGQKVNHIDVMEPEIQLACKGQDDMTASNIEQRFTPLNSQHSGSETLSCDLSQFSDLQTAEITPNAGAKHKDKSEDTEDYLVDIEDEMLMDL